MKKYTARQWTQRECDNLIYHKYKDEEEKA